MTAALASSIHAEPVDSFKMPLWFEDQSSWLTGAAGSTGAIYNYPLALRWEGPVDREALRNAVDQLVVRHDVFRTVFDNAGQGTTARVLPPRRVDWDLRDADPDELPDCAASFTLRPFDIRSDQLLRAQLIRISDENHVLLLASHHLVYDDWSNDIATREIAALYASAPHGSQSLPAISFRYGDFVRWQNDRLSGSVLAKRMAFWRKTLDHPSHFHHLQPDLDGDPNSTRGGLVSHRVEAPLAFGIQALAHETRSSLFIVMLAAFQCLLHRRSGNDDIGVASCSANRARPEVEQLIGRFGNDLVIRVSLAGNPTFRDFMRQVRGASLDGYSHQDVPFGQIMTEIAPAGHPAHKRLFQTMFILRSAPRTDATVPGVRLTRVPVALGTAKYDLNVWIDIDAGLGVAFEYRADRFSMSFMTELLKDYRQLLDAAVNAPETRISEL